MRNWAKRNGGLFFCLQFWRVRKTNASDICGNRNLDYFDFFFLLEVVVTFGYKLLPSSTSATFHASAFGFTHKGYTNTLAHRLKRAPTQLIAPATLGGSLTNVILPYIDVSAQW